MQTIQVISLARAQQRRAEFARVNRHIPYEFIDAVDGREPTPAAKLASAAFEPGLAYTPGACGCALSHLALWDRVIASGTALTIAEDDAVFRLDFAQRHDALLDGLHGDWDIVLWGWNFDSIVSLNLLPGISSTVMAFDQPRLRASMDRFQALAQPGWLAPLDKCFGIPAYTLSPSGAARFKAGCFPLGSFALYVPGLNRMVSNYGIDVAMNRLYPAVRSFVALPPLVATPNDHAMSDGQAGRSGMRPV